MNITIVNQTASPLSYLSGAVTVLASGSTSVTNTTYQFSLGTDGQLRNDIVNTVVLISDGVNSFGGVDAISYLLKIAQNIIANADGSGNLLTSTLISAKRGMDVNVINSFAAGVADQSTFTYGTSVENAIGGVYQDTSPSLTAGQQGAVRLTQNRAFHTNLRDSSGNEEGIITNPLIVSQNSLVSTVNSTTATLTASQTFTGTSEDVSNFAVIAVEVFTDQPSATLGLKPQYSPDGTNWDDGDTYFIIANDGKFFTFPPEAKFFRVVYTNGATPNTIFRLQTIFHRNMIKPSSHRIGDTMTDENDAELVKAILAARQASGTFDNLKSTANNELTTADILNISGVYGSLTVGTSAVQVKVGGSNLVNRKCITIDNTSLLTIYWGYDSSITTSAYAGRIFANQPATFNVGANVNIYLITTLAGQVIHVSEGS